MASSQEINSKQIKPVSILKNINHTIKSHSLHLTSIVDGSGKRKDGSEQRKKTGLGIKPNMTIKSSLHEEEKTNAKHRTQRTDMISVDAVSHSKLISNLPTKTNSRVLSSQFNRIRIDCDPKHFAPVTTQNKISSSNITNIASKKKLLEKSLEPTIKRSNMIHHTTKK